MERTSAIRAASLRAADWTSDREQLEFDEIFQAYSGYVARIGYRLLGCDADVDDLVQEVFLDAYRGLNGLREPAAIKGWLATIAVRRARSKLRLKRVSVVLGWRSEEHDDKLAIDASPKERLVLRAIYRCLDRLPVNERLAWSLRHIMGESLEQVAALCQCSLATAKRRIKRAQERIQMEVDHD
jgi:RNA polymerase sigma-70 factor, ECF subfamily